MVAHHTGTMFNLIPISMKIWEIGLYRRWSFMKEWRSYEWGWCPLEERPSIFMSEGEQWRKASPMTGEVHQTPSEIPWCFDLDFRPWTLCEKSFCYLPKLRFIYVLSGLGARTGKICDKGYKRICNATRVRFVMIKEDPEGAYHSVFLLSWRSYERRQSDYSPWF